jgi:hypothetical protein
MPAQWFVRLNPVTSDELFGVSRPSNTVVLLRAVQAACLDVSFTAGLMSAE